MRRGQVKWLAGAGATCVATAAVAVGTGGMAAADITPTPDRTKGKGEAFELAQAIADDPKIIRRADFTLLPPGGNPAAISDDKLAGFPRAGKTFGILSTGDATLADDKNTDPDSGTTVNGPFVRGARDVTILRIKFKRPKGANCLSIRFRFLSEEFPEFKDDEFNDGFIAELNKSTWDAASNEDPTIVAPDNFARGSNGRRISVNATDELSVTPKRARGTTYDAATRLLRASTPLGSRSVQTVYLSIFDQGDRIYDSAVFLDRMTVDKRSGCKPGTVEDS